MDVKKMRVLIVSGMAVISMMLIIAISTALNPPKPKSERIAKLPEVTQEVKKEKSEVIVPELQMQKQVTRKTKEEKKTKEKEENDWNRKEITYSDQKYTPKKVKNIYSTGYDPSKVHLKNNKKTETKQKKAADEFPLKPAKNIKIFISNSNQAKSYDQY